MDFLTDKECSTIWKSWRLWHHVESCEFDQIWFGYGDLSDITGIDIKLLKKFIKIIRDNKIAYHSPCVDSEGAPKGSGNFIYDRYIEKSWEEIKLILIKNVLEEQE